MSSDHAILEKKLDHAGVCGPGQLLAAVLKSAHELAPLQRGCRLSLERLMDMDHGDMDPQKHKRLPVIRGFGSRGKAAFVGAVVRATWAVSR